MFDYRVLLGFLDQRLKTIFWRRKFSKDIQLMITIRKCQEMKIAAGLKFKFQITTKVYIVSYL